MATLQTGTAPNQIPTNGDLGDLAFQSKESVQFTGGRGALSSINLNQIYKEIAATAVDVFVYDTSKDSDGGAWRNRTQHTSWYNETLNTATRGSRREFPSVAVIVATTTSVTIYDGDDPAMPMWMVFNRGTDTSNTSWFDGNNGATSTSLAALNGLVLLGTSAAGMFGADFIGDRSQVNYVSAASSGYRINGALANRNTYTVSRTPYSSPYSSGIGQNVNDVAVTVLANAPIDAATGLPIPTIAVATNGGVSIIKHDGTVINLLTTSGNQNSISFTASKGLETHGGGGVAYFGWGWYSMPQASTNTSDYLISDNAWSTTNIRRQGSNGNSVLYPMTTTNYGIVIRESAGVNTTDKLILIALANPAGYSLQSYLTTKYNTGWMPGDIRGAWLSDTTQETMVGSELVTSGDMSSSTGWTISSGISISGGVATYASPSHGSNLQQTATSFIAGKSYTISFSVTSYTSGRLTIYANYATSAQLVALSVVTGTGTYAYTWIASANGAGFTLQADAVSSGACSMSIDNVSIRLADPDRSVNNKGLQVFGSITKTPVATGADLVGYNLSSANYLKLPYSTTTAALGTNWSFAFWLKRIDTATWDFMISRSGPNAIHGDGIGFRTGPSSTGNLSVQAGGTHVIDTSSSAWRDTTNWQFVVVSCSSSGINFYHNGSLTYSTTTTVNFTFPDSTYFWSIGAEVLTSYSSSSIDGREKLMALFRMSATAPSAEQIKKMYEDEKVLFQDNAKATLYGTSDSVTALAYDEDTQLLHAGTSSGRSVFRGLRRVDNTTTAVGATISAANGLVAED